MCAARYEGPVVVRWADSADAFALAKAEYASLMHEPRNEPFTLDEQGLAEVWLERFIARSHYALLAEIDGQVVGVLGFDGPPKDGYIRSLYIIPERFRQGLGTRLIDTAAALVRRAGGKKLTVDVQTINYSAQAFYERLQFKRSRVKSNLIKMTKELSL